MATVTFTAELRPSGRGGGGHLVEVPDEVVLALGGKGRIPVAATFNGVPYRGSIVRMGGVAILGVTKAIMAEAGVEAGDLLEVTVRIDDAPRQVDVPPELAAALWRNEAAAAAWDRLSFTHRREYAASITEAKRADTRARRVERAIQDLAGRAGG